MALIDPSKPPGYYYVGYVTQKSLDSMLNDQQRQRWPLNTAMSNITPKSSRREAQVEAQRYHLRGITILKN